jgi:hypothetical protein
VHWVIDGKEITNCNKRIVVPSLALEFDVKPGAQTIEFTPREAGVIHWSCWMGMLRGEFDVQDAPAPAIAATTTPLQKPADERPSARSMAHDVYRAHDDVYRIAAGDTLRGIAVKLYGDGARWKEILAANPRLDPRRLKPGETIHAPGR